MSEFARIFNPKADRAAKAIAMLTNGHRYKPTEEETTHLMGILKDAVNDIAQLYGVLPGGVVVVKDVEPESRVEASRLDAKIEAVNRSWFARGDVHANVMSIPENQVTAYATSILARMCEKFEEPEAQPKNFKPKEEA